MVILNPVARKLGVLHLQVQNTVDLNRNIVFGDTALRRHIDRLFFQRVLISDLLNERNQDMKTRT